MTGASRATVAARIDRLVANGTIAAFTIRTGHETRAAGRARHRHDRGARQTRRQGRRPASRLPQVRALHSTNGKWDFIAELEDRDLVSFDETLRRIRLIDGINTTETNILLAGAGASFYRREAGAPAAHTSGYCQPSSRHTTVTTRES